jgi:GT2 family glycosyltransferase
MCASRIRLDGQDTLDSAGMLVCFDGNSKQRGSGQPARSFPASEDALLPSACAALYRRDMLMEVGLFDADFFLYCEDTDLGLRALWAGWRCRYAAHATASHHYSRTAGGVSPLKARFVERNRLWVAVKNFPLPLLAALPFVTLARYFWQFVALRRGQGQAGGFVRAGQSPLRLVAIVILAHWETLLALPALLRKRAALRSRRVLRPAEFTALLQRHRITAQELAQA